ncbi:MAG: ATP-dependent metallopeptidase FtsH/Yme1/Tma family protein, partial [Muribaculaceae bacterium]|nr:ATP-dependent metallopeptidase FtsH/Yme1/Tma family protein [Muribaculaceae bacterium]
MPIPPLNNGSNGSNNKKNPFRFSLWWMYAIVLLFLCGVFYFDNNSVTKKVNYSTFEKYVEQDHGISKIVIYSDKKVVEGFLTDSLAQALFSGSNYASGQGIEAKVEANI